MNSEKQATKRTKSLPRHLDPAYVRNPISGRYVRRNSKVYAALVSDGYLGTSTADYKKTTCIAKGTAEELKTTKNALLNSDTLDLKNSKLEIRYGKLCKVRRRLTRPELQAHIMENSISSIVEHRALFKSKLTSEQITTILTRIIDAQLMGVKLDLDGAIDQLVIEQASKPLKPIDENQVDESDDEPPPEPLKLVRQNGEYKKKPSKRKPRKRFSVRPAPPMTTTDGETTEFYTESEFSD